MTSISPDFDPANTLFVDNAGYPHKSDPFGTAVRHGMLLVRRNWLLIAAILAASLALAVVYTMLQSPRYTASSSVEIQEQSADVLGDNLGETAQSDGWDVERFLNTQLDILRSAGLAERVAQRLNLYSDDRFLEVMEVPDADRPAPDQRKRLVIGLLRGNFNAEIGVNTRVARLAFNSGDPVISADIANAFAEEFIQANLQRRYDSTSYARNFVSDQLQESRAQLEASERELNAYARNAGLIRTRDPSSEEGNSANSVTSASLMQLNSAANEAQARRVAAQARWEAERAQPLFSSSTVLDSAAVQGLMLRRSQLQEELDAARSRYLGDHPTIQRLETSLRTVSSDLNTAAQEARNSVRADYVAAQQQESSLRDRVDQLEQATLAEQDRSVRYNTLAREADTNRQLYEGLLQRFRELNASAGITASNISIIDLAEPPVFPTSPSLRLNLAIALMLGLLAAAGVVFLRDQLDDRIRVPEDIQSKVGLPVLGVIPIAQSGSPLEELEDPKSYVSEAYNALRSALLHSTPNGLPANMLVTSSDKAEGKSTTSFAIAIDMARIDKRVLIIDADMRRPNLHKIAKVSNDHGLSSVLVGETPLASAVQPSTYRNLSLLTSGPLPPSPTELLASPRLAAMLKEANEMFDFVVVDCPPVLGLADAPQVAGITDAAIFVIEADRGGSGKVKNSIRRLREANPTILGAVLSKFDPSRSDNAYSSYYGYDYYSYSPDDKVA